MARIHLLEEVEDSSVLTGVLPGLHFTVHHPCIVPLPSHMVDLCQEGCILEGGGVIHTLNGDTSVAMVTTIIHISYASDLR